MATVFEMRLLFDLGFHPMKRLKAAYDQLHMDRKKDVYVSEFRGLLLRRKEKRWLVMKREASGPPWPSYTPTKVAEGEVKTCPWSSNDELACTTAIE